MPLGGSCFEVFFLLNRTPTTQLFYFKNGVVRRGVIRLLKYPLLDADGDSVLKRYFGFFLPAILLKI